MLDRQKPEAWGTGKARAIMLDLRDRGPSTASRWSTSPGSSRMCLFVARRATAVRVAIPVVTGGVDRAASEAPAEARVATATHQPGGAPTRGATPRRTGREGGVRRGYYQRLLHRHGRGLRDILARIDETAWPALLAAYDAYSSDPPQSATASG